MKKDFKSIDIFAGIEQKNGQQWQRENGITANWKTPEQIDIDVPLPPVDNPSVRRLLHR